jgi:chemotaxis protein methyltransferase CheR
VTQAGRGQKRKPVGVQNAVTETREATDPLDPVYLRIRDLVYQTCGIYHPEEKLYLLAGACNRRMPDAKATNPKEYFEVLRSPALREVELRQLLNEITIGETCLFRSQPQLNALHNVILPELCAVRGKLGIRRLRIWSAGCSTGEEPYTLSMFMLEECDKLLKGWTFDILATDLNDRSLETAKAGVYGGYALRNTSDYFKRKYLRSAGEDKLQVNDEVKARVTFSRLNLNDESKMVHMKGMDLIFCCNVLIYFDIVSKRRVIQHFYSNLLSCGYFFLGHSESLYQVMDQFRLVHLPGATAYWKAPTEAPGGKKK